MLSTSKYGHVCHRHHRNEALGLSSIDDTGLNGLWCRPGVLLLPLCLFARSYPTLIADCSLDSVVLESSLRILLLYLRLLHFVSSLRTSVIHSCVSVYSSHNLGLLSFTASAFASVLLPLPLLLHVTMR